ncbi:MAG: hypothetical protein LBS64_00165 [Spirochaetaceae bacterium]|jgi:hypothetical protein|nr:hypothetical protein [Spirochaetaceae bacterium]
MAFDFVNENRMDFSKPTEQDRYGVLVKRGVENYEHAAIKPVGPGGGTDAILKDLLTEISTLRTEILQLKSDIANLAHIGFIPSVVSSPPLREAPEPAILPVLTGEPPDELVESAVPDLVVPDEPPDEPVESAVLDLAVPDEPPDEPVGTSRLESGSFVDAEDDSLFLSDNELQSLLSIAKETGESPGDVRDDETTNLPDDIVIPVPETAAEPEQLPPADDGHLKPELKQEIKAVLSYMDELLENLPQDKIREFARSEQYEKYKNLFTELGLI